MNIQDIEAKIKFLVEKCQKLEKENALLREQASHDEKQYQALSTRQQSAVAQVEDLIKRLKTFTGQTL